MIKRGVRRAIIAIAVILAIMWVATWIRATEQKEEHYDGGNFGLSNPGSGGSQFSVNRTATLHYVANGSTFNIYVAETSRLGDNETIFTSYIEELSRLNATDVDVTGTIEAGDYAIFGVNTGSTNESVTLRYEVTYPAHHVYDDWYPWIIVALTATVAILIYHAISTRKRDALR
jgi:hypothetical protein